PAALERAGLGHLSYKPTDAPQSLCGIRYSDEKLLAELCRVTEVVQKPTITCRDFTEHSKIGTATVERRFGGWRAALERAGLGRKRPIVVSDVHTDLWPRKWPDEVLLDEVRRVATLVDGPVLKTTDFTRLAGVSATTVAKRFGGWQAALERAGVGHLHSGQSPRRYSDQELLEEVRRVAKLVGKPSLGRKDFTLHSTIPGSALTRRFGGWHATFKRAGVGIVEPVPTEVLLEEVRRVAQIVGKPVLTSTNFAKHSEFAAETIRRRFKNWRDVLEHAGIGHTWSGEAPVYRSDEELLTEVRKIAQILGKNTLSRKEFINHSSVNERILRRRFGDWNAVLERAGLHQAS
ncbi:MAG: homing endonuclease associated repeat-containing protein, partial [Armatimonadota bacterium]